MMDAETWMNANEAMRLGFVDGILFAEDDLDKKPEEEPDEPDEPGKKEPPAQAYSRKQTVQAFLVKLGQSKSDKTVDAAQLRARLNLLKP